jgi:hypothetical protein
MTTETDNQLGGCITAAQSTPNKDFITSHVASCINPIYMRVLNTIRDAEDRAKEEELILD